MDLGLSFLFQSMASNGDNNNSMGFQKRDESAVNCQSSGMSTDHFFPATWDPVVSLSQNESFRGSSILSQSEFNGSPYTVALENQGIPSNSHLVHYQSDSSFAEMVPKFPCFGSGSFSEMVDSLGLTDCSQISNFGCPPNYTSNRQSNNERTMQISAQTQEDHHISAEPGMGALHYGKRRKRGAESSSPLPDKDAEGAVQKDSSAEISDVPNEQDEKKAKSEQNISGANLKSKQTAKQTKENACSGEAPKENYIHVRARRGQATNSHSLAERVRREKISERMRMLQELVPGCNKITGKAVMLDEIINYVQSLQQQVEFLSMKLATVNPELNIGLDRILSKDVLHARSGNGAILGLNPGISSQPYPHGILPAGMQVISNTNHQILSSAHTLMDNDFQTLFQMGYNSSSAMDNLGVNGHLKPEP